MKEETSIKRGLMEVKEFAQAAGRNKITIYHKLWEKKSKVYGGMGTGSFLQVI